MLLAIAALIAAVLTLLSFVAPSVLGSTLALAIAAAVLRIAAVALLHRSVPSSTSDVRRGTVALMVCEGLLLAATIIGLPIEPHVEGGAAGWIGLAIWFVYGAGYAYGGLKLIPVAGWCRAGGILLAASGGFWLTQIGLVVWPFSMAAGFLCLAMAGFRHEEPRVSQRPI